MNPIMQGADPFIIQENGKYYLYFTDLDDGFKVYTSTDLVSFIDEGYCLKKGHNVVGSGGFWAPEIIKEKDYYYMVYVCDEHLAIAKSKSLLGPFYQEKIEYIDDERMIDGHFFRDDDGTIYLYFVRFTHGNVIYVAKMNDEMTSFVKETVTHLIEAEEPWETKDCLVAEGPFVLKKNGIYYLTYSCNHTRSQDYAIGYATSSNPMGPFVKYENNPILAKNDKVVGVGHHSFFKRSGDDHLMCVYHCHQSLTQAFPRKVCIDEAHFDENGILVIDGPTSK